MRHKVIVSNAVGAPAACVRLIKKAVRRTLSVQGVEAKCTVSVLITGPEEIKELNTRMRGVESVTDVLSFPALNIKAGEQPVPDAYDRHGAYLGDMAINIERAKEQALEYGHSLERETAYLAVHSVLHLLGYDHMDEGEDKKLMRSREEAVLETMSLSR